MTSHLRTSRQVVEVGAGCVVARGAGCEMGREEMNVRLVGLHIQRVGPGTARNPVHKQDRAKLGQARLPCPTHLKSSNSMAEVVLAPSMARTPVGPTPKPAITLIATGLRTPGMRREAEKEP